jgi:hypothetical protein
MALLFIVSVTFASQNSRDNFQNHLLGFAAIIRQDKIEAIWLRDSSPALR